MVFFAETNMVLHKIISFVLLTYMTISFSQPSLDQLGVSCQTDKSSIHHNYLPTYQKYLESYRNQSFRFLEIGFWKGASARMWQAYFPLATLHFIDNDPKFLSIAKELTSRCKLFILDQSNARELQAFLQRNGGNYDVIIDDGGHSMKQQMVSFNVLFPHLKSGGIYIIEDLHTSYHPQYIDDKVKTTDFLKSLVDDLNHIGFINWCADHNKCPTSLKAGLSIYQTQIAAIHFYSSICIIEKR